MNNMFAKFATQTARIAGSAWAFIVILALTIIWFALGPYYKYSDPWQLACNTISTILTTLMVFIIQNAQNREMKAVNLKLDEIILSKDKADNRLINIENLTEEELAQIHLKYEQIAQELRHTCVEPAVQTKPHLPQE